MNVAYKPYEQAQRIILSSLVKQLALGPVLLLLSGGSASSVYQDLADSLTLELQPGQLVVGLVDERYDLDPNHLNSNHRLICSTGIITRMEQLGAIYCPILHGRPMVEEVSQYQYQLTQFIQHEHRRLVTVLGIGPDGHIAGILPNNNLNDFNARFDSNSLVTGYTNNGPYPQRITTTLPLLKLAQSTIVLIKDAAKISLVERACNNARPEPLNLLPATIIQEIKEVTIAAPSKEEA